MNKFNILTIITLLMCITIRADVCPGRRTLREERFHACTYMTLENCSSVTPPIKKGPKNNSIQNLNTWADTIIDWSCCELLISNPDDVRTFISKWQSMCYRNVKLLQRGMFDVAINFNYEQIVNFCPDSLIQTEHDYSTLENVLERNFNHDSQIECGTPPELNQVDEYGSFTILYSQNSSRMGIGHLVGVFNHDTNLANNNFVNWSMDFSADKAGCRGEENFENDVMDQYTFFRGGLGVVHSVSDYQAQGEFEITSGYVFNNVNITIMKNRWIKFQEENGYDLIQSNCAHAVWEVLIAGFDHCILTQDIASDFMWPHKTIDLIIKLAESSKQGKSLSVMELSLLNKWFLNY